MTSQRWSSLNHCGQSGYSAASPGRPPGEREELVPGVAVGELHLPDGGQHPAGVVRHGVHRAERVLAAVARAHAAAQAGLVAGDEARPVQRRAALDLVPEVEHRVRVGVGRLDGEAREVRGPVIAEGRESGGDLGRIREASHDSADLRRPFRGAHDVDDLALLARGQLDVVGQRADAVAARRGGVGGRARLDDDRVGEVPPAADEILAVAGVAGRRLAAAEEVRQRLELGPDPDDPVLAAAEDDVLGPVQVGQVVERVGEAELGVAERAQAARGRPGVANLQDPQLARRRLIDRAERHEVQNLRPDPFVGAGDPRVGRAVPALVASPGAA